MSFPSCRAVIATVADLRDDVIGLVGLSVEIPEEAEVRYALAHPPRDSGKRLKRDCVLEAVESGGHIAMFEENLGWL